MTELRKRKRGLISVMLMLVLTVSLLCSCGEVNLEESLDDEISETSTYLAETVKNPESASAGGEWALKGIIASGTGLGDGRIIDLYYDNVRAKVKAAKGKIDEDDHYTEYARVTIGLDVAGKNPHDVEGYDMVKPLDDYEKITNQGINAAAYALVASNVSGVKLENEDKYIDFIISELDSSDIKSDDYSADYVSMALLGMSFYEDRDDVKKATEKYVGVLSDMVDEDGSLGNCETNAEAVVALSQLGIDVLKDERFQKDGKNPASAMMKYKVKDGAFCHSLKDKEPDLMATEKALLALDSMKLMKDGTKLYESRL